MKPITKREERYDKRCSKKNVEDQKKERDERYEKRCKQKEEQNEIKLSVKVDVKEEIKKMVSSPIMTRSRMSNEKYFFFD